MDSYEKKYKEALELAKDYFKANQELGELEENDMLSDIFPELKESEDEWIRKCIGDVVRKHDWSHIFGVTKDDCLAWLEKQGEQSDVNKEYWRGYNEGKQCILDKYAELEKQGEQKPVDKVEPKFKVGDWIIQENIGVYKVIEICKSWYEVIDSEDNHYSISFDKEYMCRLWTIQDAKPGDVIYLPNGNNEYYFFIFKGIENAAVMSFAHFYQYNDGTSEVEGTIDNLFSVNDVFQPSTKEQRDTLMKAMADARYTFDFEKKKLRKIEQKPTDEEMKEALRTEYEKGRADAIAEIQNPAWNEEDESYLNTTIAYLKDAKEFKKTAENCMDWLKSLKDRVQPRRRHTIFDEII